jgi:hypothetical protein
MITQDNLQQRPLSYSSLKEFGKSPAHYIEYLRKERKTTPAMLFGSMVHCLLLEPAKFDSQFAVMENVDKRTKDGKEKYEAFLISSAGKEVVSRDQYDEAVQLVNKAFEMQHVRDAVSGCHTFETEWRTEVEGLPFRGFFDGEADDYILEVKTANDASPKTIIRDFYDRMYHLQAGLYNLASGGKEIKYLIIETTAPYSIILATPTSEYIDKGIADAHRLANEFHTCMENDLWNMSYDFYTKGEFVIDLPTWVK